ncbi:MAG: TrmB family transcriptional regulator [Candidatus Aenigmarchaeota archaeon]|nr:TrmB family transcriptional regulator [Candidatus Aenigmarchaeota archaeon]
MVITQIVPRKVLEGLRGIGLNLYERNIYAALLIKKVATASELSDLSGVPRARAYDVLESLEEKGMVIIQSGSPFKYVAVEPMEAVERMRMNILKHAEASGKRLRELKDSEIMRDLTTLFQKDLHVVNPSDFSGVIKSEDKVNFHVKSMLGKTTKYAKILTSERGLENLTYHIKTLSKLKGAKVPVFVAAPITDRNKSIVAELLPYVEIRDISGLKKDYSRMHIFDGAHVILGLTDEKEVESTQDTVFWTQSEHMAKNLMEPVFDHLWKKGTPPK